MTFPQRSADDVVVESIDKVDCYQAKHAQDPHALLNFQDLIGTTDLHLNIRRLKVAWDSLRPYGKEV
jgi:predicted NACHT family NTPase